MKSPAGTAPEEKNAGNKNYCIVFSLLRILSSRWLIMASYVAPELRDKFETLSIDLKNNILERNVQLNTIYDLIDILEVISRGDWDTFIVLFA